MLTLSQHSLKVNMTEKQQGHIKHFTNESLTNVWRNLIQYSNH